MINYNYDCKQVTALTKINGNSGRKDATRIIRSVADNVISPDFWDKITWTGKTGITGYKKIAMEVYLNIVQLICDVCMAADRTKVEADVIKLIKYSVIKRATRTPQGTSSASSTERSASHTPELHTVSTPHGNVQSLQNPNHHPQQLGNASHIANVQTAPNPHGNFEPKQSNQYHAHLAQQMTSFQHAQQPHFQPIHHHQRNIVVGAYHNNQFGEVSSHQPPSHPQAPPSDHLTSLSQQFHPVDSYDAPSWSYSIAKL